MGKGFINFPIFENKDHIAKVDWLEKTPLPFQVYALDQMTEERYINVNHSNCLFLFFSIHILIYLFTKIIIPLRRSHIQSSKRSYKHRLLKGSSFILFWQTKIGWKKETRWKEETSWNKKNTPIIIGKVTVKGSIWKPHITSCL